MIDAYLQRHAQALIGSIGELWRSPAATLMSIAVIGISLAFPTALYVAVQSIEQLSGTWDNGRQISLFLKTGASERVAEALAARLRALPEVASTAAVSPSAGLAEFKRNSGFGASLDALETNPLPAVVVVRPRNGLDAVAVRQLAERLKAEQDVDLAQLDLQWVQRLQSLLRIAERTVWIFAVLLSLGVTLIIGNTIRLAVANRRTEIEVIMLVGGTPAFIRRPFVYAGAVQGLLGGLTAWAVVGIALLLLHGPVSELASLYHANWSIAGFSSAAGLTLCVGGAFLGYAGAWIAVARHLR